MRPSHRSARRAGSAVLDVPDKSARVRNFHANTLKAPRDLICAAGLRHPAALGPEHILLRA